MQLVKIIKRPEIAGLVGLVGIAGLVGLLFTLVYQTYYLAVKFDEPDKNYIASIQPYLEGVFLPEHNANFGYSWTKPQFSVTVPALARRDYTVRLWTLHLLETHNNATLKVGDDFTVNFTLPEGEVPQPITFTIPASAIKNNTLKFQFNVPAFQPPKDPRGELGLLVNRLEMEGLPRTGILPPRNVVGSVLLLMGLLYLMVWGVARQTTGQLLGLLLPLGSGLYLAKYLTDNPLTFSRLLERVLLTVEGFLILEYTILGLLALSRFFLNWRKGDEVEVARPNHLHALTGVRYIAALMVLFLHLPIDPNLPDQLYALVRHGYAGVSLFFILSGFVMCYNYFEPLQKSFTRKIGPFWFARFARIYPMYLLALLLNLCLITPKSNPSFGVFLLHALALQSYTLDPDVINIFNKPSWSISTEFFFYLVFPLILIGGVRYLRRPWQVLSVGAVIWLLQMWAETFVSGFGEDVLLKLLYWSGTGRLGEFVLGVLAGRLFLMWHKRPITRPKLIATSLLVALLLIFILNIMCQDAKGLQRIYIFSPAFCLFIYWLARFPTKVSRALGSPAMRLLGDASFSLYLLHFTILEFLFRDTISKYLLSDYVILAAILIITTVLSIITYTWYETPMRLWLRGNRSPSQTIRIADK
ncbi:MAG: acyltransferase [Chloroflexi bacterium]|nr:acyltransferase [Chloroflexota bacterium]